MGHTLLLVDGSDHPDTTWTKKVKAKGVAVWYEDKYPGVKGDGAIAGARRADDH
jgi:hypothetical protein